MNHYFAIIPAAGIGSRIKSDIPKQYLTINNQIILERVVNLFSSRDDIKKVVVVLHPQDKWWPSLNLVYPEKIATVIGGKERVHSVLLGLDFLGHFADQHDWVLVHDAARPFLSNDNITTVLQATKNHPVGGLLGVPVVDTIKRVDNENNVVETISRDCLWQAQTPQCFRYQLLKSSIEKALAENKGVTDESSAIEYAGFKPKMILGDVRNKKVTFVDDF